MKGLFFLFLIILSLPAFAELREFEGKIGNMPYWMVSPPGKNLPVVYFLHGRGGHRHMFRDLGGVQVLTEYFATGGTPFAVVALTGTFEGQDTYWVNHADKKKLQMRDLIIKKWIPKIERKHKIGGEDHRMIAGISMGSHGAFQLALNSTYFKCVAAHSLVLRDFKSMSQQFPGVFGTLQDFEKRDPISLIRKIDVKSKVPFQKVWVDIGGKDVPEFISRAKIMEDELLRLGFDADFIDVANHFPDGAHDFPYWSSRLPDYVDWYGQCFN